jgi:hypothetical protein
VEIPLPLVAIRSNTLRPPGFATDANQAMSIAEHTHTMQALHRHEHPLEIVADVWYGGKQHYWYISFGYHGKVVALANISPTGRVLGVWTGPQAIAPYSHGNYAAQFDVWWVVVPFSVLFFLPFLDLRRLWRMAHLDGLVVLSFLISYALFNHGKLEPAVWMAYPPLVYLLVRMLYLGFRGRAARGRLAPLLPSGVLIGGLLLLVGARIALSLVDPNVIDVGYASVIGAHRITHGMPLYYNNPAHGDTYGPIAYLAYVPFESLFPWKGRWDTLPSAHAASIAFDVLTIIALIALGRRMRGGRDGTRLGLLLAWGWAACPFTLLALMEHVNDGLISLLSVISLLVFASPAARGALLGLAAAAKFSPAALLGLYAGRDRRGIKGSAICALSFAAVVALSIVMYLPPGGFSEFYNHTIGFQLTRMDVFSPWALHPSLDPIKTALLVLAVLIAAGVAFIPRKRSLAQVCALAAAVTIAVQLPAVHWFYYYIVWFVPYVLVAVLAQLPAPVKRTLAERAEANEDVDGVEPDRVPVLTPA